MVLRRLENETGSPGMVYIGILESHVRAENSTLVLWKIIRHSKLLFHLAKTILFKYHISRGGPLC